MCKELINHPTFKSDLVVGLACFDYAVLFTMPKDQAAGCYSRLFYSFCVRGWLAKELQNIHMDDYMEFIDDIRFVHLDELHIGPKIEDMILSCHQVRSWRNKNRRPTYSSCVVCVWCTWCLNCPPLLWVLLVRVLLKLTCRIILSPYRAIY